MKERLLFYVTPANDVTQVGRQQRALALEIVFDVRARRLTVLAGHGTAGGLRSMTATTLNGFLDLLSDELAQVYKFSMPDEVRTNFLPVLRKFTRGRIPDAPS